MRSLRFLIVAGLLVCICAVSSGDEATKGKPLKIAMYSGSAEYKSSESLADLKRQLEEQFGASCSLHVADEKGTTLTGIEDLETCDVAVIFTRRLKLDQ